MLIIDIICCFCFLYRNNKICTFTSLMSGLRKEKCNFWFLLPIVANTCTFPEQVNRQKIEKKKINDPMKFFLFIWFSAINSLLCFAGGLQKCIQYLFKDI